MFKNLSKPINVSVISVDAKLDFTIQKSATGRLLFEQIAKTLGLREIWYFGIQFCDKDGELCWLKLDKKISSQVELKAKEKPLEFYFRIKYFPEDVQEELIESITKDYFFLQVRASILDGSIYCPAEAAVLLASYVCQIRLGEYSDDKLSRIPAVEKILPPEVLEKHKFSSDEWLSRIHQCYQAHGDMNREDAIMEYLKICQDLEMYGVEYFPIKNKKGTDLWLGIDSMGLNIYEREDKLTPKIGFPWGEVKHISYSGKQFKLKPTDKTAKEWHFFVDRVRTNRQILALSIGNHELYMRRRSPESIEVQQMRRKAQELKEERARQLEATKAEIEAWKAKALQEREEAKRQMDRYELEMQQLNDALHREKECRLELENTQEELRKVNMRLEEQFAQTADEKHKLMSDREELETRVREQEAKLQEQERKKADLNKQLSEAMAQGSNGHGDSNNNEINNNLDESEKDDDAKELQVIENFSRREEMRESEESRNQRLKTQLSSLRSDLHTNRDESKLTPVDRRYEDNRRRGQDKFKTLREIRKGNTKKRIDEFEAM